MNGKYKPKKVFDTEEAGTDWPHLKPGKIYYSIETDVQWEYDYFVYDISKNTTTEITYEEYDRIVYGN